MKIDWKQKLSSRKFWVALVNFVTNILIVFNVQESEITKITALILACGGLVAYIFAEGYVDANREIILEFPSDMSELNQ